MLKAKGDHHMGFGNGKKLYHQIKVNSLKKDRKYHLFTEKKLEVV
ncbi:hypothetical protein SOE_02026 [Enterococcus faecalis EnGen0202]|nr:hypothetical protein S9O_01916 [Enterococcus faecalis EnGen0119]EOE89355.1 hypothetical protein S9U_01924 [Enterococcus faecalis EnGen0095]EOE91735.1 hypothetical protein S9W_01927 [Enterococcus faecalis EnGen0096]EOE98502.1 hypothetical protein SA5_02293 [Enterococcus faecalis EnGen0098]EOF09203.1 hypothetical protein SAE_01952 [Enterococcus faecalis EnGen0113]EOG61285.1 hypothetical protein SOI_01932 [Enterococcus faecalis EnGen0204]EOG62828.1 hypothetical protein SOK_02279 [Enterococcus